MVSSGRTCHWARRHARDWHCEMCRLDELFTQGKAGGIGAGGGVDVIGTGKEGRVWRDGWERVGGGGELFTPGREK